VAQASALEIGGVADPRLARHDADGDRALTQAFEQGRSFLTTVGTVIVALSFVLWWLSAYPKVGESPEARDLRNEAARIEASEPGTSAALLAEADRFDQRVQQEASFAGRIGRTLEPAFAPLGYDWRLTVGVVTSFAAREVFVSTLAVLVGSPEEDGEMGVLERIQNARRDDGRPLLTTATAVSLLVFFVLAMQCVSTWVTVRRETRSWRWPLVQFAWMTGFAWLGAAAAFQLLGALGIA